MAFDTLVLALASDFVSFGTTLREGVYREMRLRQHYEKPSEKRARERAAAISWACKADRKRADRNR